ncbi:MAG: tRNA threonylcarbamoyladenosine dehydratase [Candidatus Omnitrophica bacterium]|nr:tRNA threonylcarbamoyladenosine dehydratase [Candidatus Omnitrophota bacterium]
MKNEFSRTELLIGKKNLNTLRHATVAVFGIGGVGSYTVEALARCGVGRIVMIDDDLICLTNINRQLHATHRTIGRPKVEVMKERILEINPKAHVETHQTFYLPDNGADLIKKNYDYVVDALDTVTAKIDIVIRSQALKIPVISCMGSGKKLDPTKFEIADLFNTSVCPLCRVMRIELRKRGINSLKVVYSKEPLLEPFVVDDASCNSSCVCPKGSSIRKCSDRRDIPGTISFIPSVAGLIAASAVVRDLIAGDDETTKN